MRRTQLTVAAAVAALSALGAARTGDSPFDRIDADLGRYLDHHDPLSFAMKIKSISTDEYTFWRGTKYLFYQWCKSNCADWLADRDAYVISHGDLHLGNIGTYPTADWGRTAFGMVDFDESARLPFQIELLQGLITFDLLAKQNGIAISVAQRKALVETQLRSYAASLTSGQTASNLLRRDSTVSEMLNRPPADYEKDTAKYVENGRFKSSTGGPKVSNLMLPVDPARFNDFAAAIATAAQRDPRLAEMLRYRDVAAIRPAMLDVARRIRTGSSGSQGLAKYFVLLKHPFKNYDGDAIIYLKLIIPAAAERAGAIDVDPRLPAERYVADMAALTNPPPIFSSWATIGSESFWVSMKEPWSDELAYNRVDSYDALRDIAVIWGDVAGAAHARAGDGQLLQSQLVPALRQTLLTRAAAYEVNNGGDFASFRIDSRTRQCIAAATEAAVKDARSR